MKILLAGFMGSGKSTVGKALAEALKIPFVEMDEEIVKNSGFASISEIFKKKGEIFFRELEIQTAKKIAFKLDKAVVASGGGIVENKIILDYFKVNGFLIVYLRGRFNTFKSRLDGFNDRPLFKDVVQAEKLYNKRVKLYEEYADMVVEVDSLIIEQIVDKIYEDVI